MNHSIAVHGSWSMVDGPPTPTPSSASSDQPGTGLDGACRCSKPSTINHQPSTAVFTIGFTLIELLVVMAIIALLAGLVVIGLAEARARSRALQTTQRIDDALAAVSRQGIAAGSIVYSLQRDMPDLGGTLAFARAKNSSVTLPVGGVWHECFPDPDATAPGNPVIPAAGAGRPLVMAYPWGQPRLYLIRESWYANAFGLPTTEPKTWNDADRAAWRGTEPHRIQELWPGRSAELFAYLKVAPSADAWRDERSSKQPWNDAWGSPLIMAYALYQPPRCTLPAPAAPAVDTYLLDALREYRYNRAIYLAVGAVGPELDPVRFPSGSLSGDWPADLAGMWGQITDVCAGPSAPWDEKSFDRPPWTGTKRGKSTIQGRSLISFLSAPAECK